ncbi:hypothetical protein B0F90DRAFT_882724 [Multifurca ochricompacta]|uniref:Uncharacterized protein n=1 Tax=Multifurca ochricompacta TaxID=376703 RepID=A0AAD4QM00_9AGAM|nr:hypothetical protein B0F90DRAFT_882724 [Multifurca ochricompacta]
MSAPWWTSSLDAFPVNVPVSRPARPPDIMIIPEGLLAAPTTPHSSARVFPLAYNLVAILVAYAYASRYLSTYPLASTTVTTAATTTTTITSFEARALVSRLVPFLVVRDDRTRFPGIESASTDIFSRFEAGSVTPAAFTLVLRDAATFLRPKLVAEQADDDDNDDGGEALTAVGALRALSDLHALFEPSSPRVAAKVVFYAAQVRRASAAILRALAADVERWAVKLEEEGKKGNEEVSGLGGGGDDTAVREGVDRISDNGDSQGKHLIVELT